MCVKSNNVSHMGSGPGDPKGLLSSMKDVSEVEKTLTATHMYIGGMEGYREDGYLKISS